MASACTNIPITTIHVNASVSMLLHVIPKPFLEDAAFPEDHHRIIWRPNPHIPLINET